MPQGPQNPHPQLPRPAVDEEAAARPGPGSPRSLTAKGHNRGRTGSARARRAAVPSWGPQTRVQSLLCLRPVTWGKPCPSLSRQDTEQIALRWAPGLPSSEHRGSGQASARRGTGGLAVPRVDDVSPLTGGGLWGHTHASPGCGYPQQRQPHASTRTHAHMATPRTDTQVHTQAHPVSLQGGLHPPTSHQLSESLSPQAWATDTSSSWAPPSPSLSLPPPSASLSHPEAPRVGHQHMGRGRRPKSLPSPQAPLPPHFCPGTSPTSPPVAPTQDQAPPAHQLALPLASLKAGVVWEEFRNGGRWGDGDKRKRRKGGDLYTKQCAGSAADRAKVLGRLPRGRPPIILNPPIPAVPLGSLQANPSAGRLHPHPHGPTHCIQNHCLACPSSWKTRLLLGKWASVFLPVSR